jgi:hypothetical protein
VREAFIVRVSARTVSDAAVLRSAGIGLPDAGAEAVAMEMQPDGKGIIWGYAPIEQQLVSRQNRHIGAFAKHQSSNFAAVQRDLEHATEHLPVAQLGEVKSELGKEADSGGPQPELFGELAAQCVDRILAGLECAAKQSPMARIEDLRFLITELNEVAPVLEHQEGSGGIRTSEWRPGTEEAIDRHTNQLADRPRDRQAGREREGGLSMPPVEYYSVVGAAYSNPSSIELTNALARAHAPRTRRIRSMSAVGDRVSGIVPRYNHGRMIRRQIAALMRQQLPATEIIVVDDGSSEAKIAEVREVIGDCPTARLEITGRNRGTPAGCNTELALASGDFVCFHATDARRERQCWLRYESARLEAGEQAPEIVREKHL